MPPSKLVLLGRPVANSLSPRIQKAALDAAGLRVTYVAMDVTARDFEREFAQVCLRNGGGNITIPHKRIAFTLCERLTQTAQLAQAVNTFWSVDGRAVGDNTDVPGFDAAARALYTAAGRKLPQRIALLGAGGAASAVAVATSAWPGTSVAVWSRSHEKASALAQRFAHVRASVSIAEAVDDADLVVNATPLGMHGNDIPFPVDKLPESCAVLDLVYRHGGTAWVNEALLSGRPAADGLRMLVEQGAFAFERWFGIAPDRGAMLRAARETME